MYVLAMEADLKTAEQEPKLISRKGLVQIASPLDQLMGPRLENNEGKTDHAARAGNK